MQKIADQQSERYVGWPTRLLFNRILAELAAQGGGSKAAEALIVAG